MSITLTESAARQLHEFLEQRAAGTALRLGVTSSGCSGFAYTMDFTDEVGSDDLVFEEQGVRLVVDPKSLAVLDGMQVDYVREGLNRSFKFNNPNVTATCGCGESFAV
ncbi:MAG TPA: iron-sulfur cluster assembly accessory protein [Gammaproteobacteria bacterium]